MGDQVSPERSMQVGVFVVNLRSGEVRRNGHRILLPDQPFKVLAVLLRQPGRLVSRTEFHTELWPEDTFVDFEHGLNSAVARLRASLNDSAESPAYIETVGGRGYRLIARVQELGQERDSDGPSPLAVPVSVPVPAPDMTTAEPEAAAFPRKLVELLSSNKIVLLCLSVAVIGAVWLYISRHEETNLPPPKVVPLTSLPDRAECSNLSPDGNRVAFTRQSESPELSGIYLKQIGTDDYLQITRSVSDWCPAWSPDGRYLAFSRYGEQQHSIYLISALGGAERKLHSAPPATPLLDWSPDAKFIAFSAAPEGHSTSVISLLSVDTLQEHALTEAVAGAQDWGPAFSPDGRHLAFVRTNANHMKSEIYLMAVGGSGTRRLTYDDARIPSAPVWTRDGQSIIFSSDRTGLPTLWRIPASGGSPIQVLGVGVKAHRPTLAQKGDRLAFEQGTASSSLWIQNLVDLDKKGSRRKLNASRGCNGPGEFSPDDSKIAFISDRSENAAVYICNADGSNLLQVSNPTSVRSPGPPRWSPDGQSIVLDAVYRGHTTILVMPTNGGRPHPLTEQTSDNLNPSWSHNGRWIYFTSNRSGQWQIWKMPSAGGEALQLTRQGGFVAFESADGKSIYYAKTASEPDIWRMQFDSRQEAPVSPPIHVNQWTGWALTVNGIFLVRENPEAHPVLRFLDFAAGRVHDITPLEKQNFPLWFSVSADGKFVLYQQVDVLVTNVMMLENFR